MNAADAKGGLARLDGISRAMDRGSIEDVLALSREAFAYGLELCKGVEPSEDVEDALEGLGHYFESIAFAILWAQTLHDARRSGTVE